MALLKDFEGDQLEPAELSKTGSPLVPGDEEESFQMHRPREKKDKRSRLSDEGKKLSSLSLRRGKPKEPGVEKTPKRGKHVRSKSGSRTPPDSPKSTRAAAAESGRKPSKPTIGQLQPSPNVKSTRKRYAVLGKDAISTESESGEESGLMVSNQAVAGGHAHQVDADKPEDTPSSPSALQPFFPAAQPSSPHFPVPFSPQPEPGPEIPAPQEALAPFAVQNPLTHELASPGQPPGSYHQFFMSPMPHPPLQPSSVAAAPPPSSQDADWTISEELKTKCSHQFAELRPEDGRLSGDKARTFFVQSRLPNQELSQIWRMSDWDKDNALSEQEFCVAMKLVLMRRRGHAIPASLPDPLRPQSQEGLFSDSFVPPVQPLPPPPSHPSHRPRPPRSTQSSIELPLPPEEKQSEPVAAIVTAEPATAKIPLSKIVQQSAPDLLKARDSEDSHVTNPIYVEVNDQSTSDVGPLVATEEEEEEEEVVSDPPVGRIISYESADESEGGGEDESSTIVQTRRRTSSEGSTRTPPLVLKPSVPTKPANIGRSKSLRQAPELPPRPVPPSADNAESESTPMISVQAASPKTTSRRMSRPATLVTKTKKYQTMGSGSPSPTSPVVAEGSDGKDSTWLEPVGPTLPSKRSHARSASLDLKKMMSPDVVADVPPAMPPPPPPKPHHVPSPSEEKPVVRRRSASTSSISSTTPTAAVSVDKRSATPEDQSMDTSTHQLLGQSVSPPPRPRQPTKKAPIFPPKPRRPPPPIKPKAEAETEVAEPAKTQEYRPIRSKSQLQVTIRSLKETNATLTAINKGLEEKLFILMEERVKLSRELELAQTAQQQY